MVFSLWYISYVHAYRINIANPIEGFFWGRHKLRSRAFKSAPERCSRDSPSSERSPSSTIPRSAPHFRDDNDDNSRNIVHCRSQQPHQLERRAMAPWKPKLTFILSTAPKQGRRSSVLNALAPKLTIGK